MKSFNPSLLTHSFRQLTLYEQQSLSRNSPDVEVPYEYKADVSLSLSTARVIATVAELDETGDAIARLDSHLISTAEPVTYVHLQHALHHLLQLMQSQLEKRKVFVINPGMSKYYQDDIHGIKPPHETPFKNDIFGAFKPPPWLFSERAVRAFPSAYMDIVEAGRCLALNRNNASIYHLMQVAEIGLRVLAWDRRAEVIKWKKTIPLEFSQWGDMIVAIRKQKDLIDNWPRSKAVKEAANRYYMRAIFEVESFNEIFRKHISHARGELYEPDTAISCWGHVYRFMDMLSERMSETHRTSTS
jgi:hypothetical protein